MKMFMLLAMIPAFFSNLVLADDKEGELDFSKAFPKEKISSTTVMKELGIETYGYLTNTSMEELEKTFAKFLGKGWVKEDIGKKIKGHLKIEEPDTPKVPIEIERMVQFTPKDISWGSVMLSHAKMEIGATKFLVSVMVMRTKKEAGEEESAPDPPKGDAPTGGVLRPAQKK